MRVSTLLAGMSLFLTAFSAMAVADTVMVYVEVTPVVANADYSKAITDQASKLRSDVEDGVMGQFFDAGHIIFNEIPAPGVQPSKPGDSTKDMQKWYEVRQAAIKGGASRLVTVELTIAPDKSGRKAVPIAAYYSLWKLLPGDEVQSGSLRAESLKDGVKGGSDDVCQLMGQTIATDLLNEW